MPFLPLAFLTALAATPSPPGPTVAVEDTMHTQVSEVLVRAPRVTLDEILDRVARGEARRESLMVDQSFTASIRVVRRPGKNRAPELFEESVYRVYRKRPDHLRQVLLRRYEAHPEKKGNDDVDVTFSPRMSEQIVNFAFRPESRRDYRYRIAGRDLVGTHLIYRLAFAPKSVLQGFEPSGLVWVDTNEFVIVREELSFPQSPIPLIVRGIDRAVVERQRVGDHWVLSRVVLRATLTVPIPKFGQGFDMGIQYQDYAMNTGLPDSLFTAPERARRGGRR